MIPQQIHYFWLSRREKPDEVKRCIDSWHRFCPDYEITEWNEDNFDCFSNAYMREAYEAGTYGFVTDLARLEILYQYGGVYMDTDVELLRAPDSLLHQSGFVGVEKSGGFCGAVPGNVIIRRIIEFRKGEHFHRQNGTYNTMTCGYYETIPLMQMGFRPDNTMQTVGDLTVYPSDFFHPFDYMSGETCITDNTYSIHHFSSSWLSEKAHEERTFCQKHYSEILERMGAVCGNKMSNKF